jgi:hypothetical protein
VKNAVFTLRNSIVPDFFQHFERLGYQQLPAQHIVPENDPTLVFTNSTICLCKNQLVEGSVRTPGYCMQQPSLRFQNLKFGGTKYLCFFQMLGVVFNPERYQDAVEELWSYLTITLEVPPERWIFLHSEITRSFSQQWLEKPGISAEMDTYDPSYYQWRYGLDEQGVAGTGITFSITQADGTAEEVATLIQITKHGEVIAYEFCFGVEVMIAAIENEPGIHCASFISKVLPFRDTVESRRLQDSIATLTAMYHYGVKAGCQNNPNAIAKKVMKQLRELVDTMNIREEDIRSWVSGFEQLEFGTTTDASDRIINDLGRY